MVVASNDLAPLDAGFAPDAAEAIPGGEDGLIPADSDVAALSGLAPDDAAASDVVDDQSDPDPDAALRQQVEAQLRDQLTQELQSTFDQRLREYQSTKDREVAQARNHASQLTAFNQSLIEAYVQRLSEAGLEQAEIERDLDALQGRTQRRAQQQAQSVQQADAKFFEWAQESVQRMLQHDQQRALADDGKTQLFDPATDADLQRLAQELYINAREYNRTNDERYAVAAQQARQARDARIAQLREEGLKRHLLAQQRQKAAPQQQARKAQAERGRQAVATGGGAAPPSDADFMAQAEQLAKERGLDPNKQYADVHKIYLSLKYSDPTRR